MSLDAAGSTVSPLEASDAELEPSAEPGKSNEKHAPQSSNSSQQNPESFSASGKGRAANCDPEDTKASQRKPHKAAPISRNLRITPGENPPSSHSRASAGSSPPPALPPPPPPPHTHPGPPTSLPPICSRPSSQNLLSAPRSSGRTRMAHCGLTTRFLAASAPKRISNTRKTSSIGSLRRTIRAVCAGNGLKTA